jgi:hypothetical protein
MMRWVARACAFLVVAVVAASGGSGSPSTVSAAHHLAEISEVMVGFNGDPQVQFVEINQRAAGQNIVMNSRLSAFGPNGTFLGVVLVVPANVSNSGDGVPWIMGTPQFESASGIQADFEFPPGILAPGSGMVCWGSPGLVPPSPSSWDPTNPNNYVDCVAYGGYTGFVPSAPPSSLPPGDCQRSLTRVVPATFDAVTPPTDTWADGSNASDFMLAAPSPTNNAGQTGTLVASPDTDGDGEADCRDADDDADGVPDGLDNCRLVANPDQTDADSDLAGAACDPDDTVVDFDADGCADGEELRLLSPPLNPTDPWDFYSVPVPALFAASDPSFVIRDAAVKAADAQAVFAYSKRVDAKQAGSFYYEADLNGNGVKDGWEYDRSIAGAGPPGAPDGTITAQDAQKAFAQAKLGYNCSGPP